MKEREIPARADPLFDGEHRTYPVQHEIIDNIDWGGHGPHAPAWQFLSYMHRLGGLTAAIRSPFSQGRLSSARH
ncbi:hypothetical protein VTN96DRAFT_8757 [Rasamsonia emersonii]